MEKSNGTQVSESDEEIAEVINILLVDDDDFDRANIKRMLSGFEQVKFRIDEANRFDDAIAMLSEKHYDSFLIDYYLDGRTGIELLESIKCKTPYSSSILLTGLDERSIDRNAMEAGASDYICKDEITPKLLGRAICYSVHQKQIDRERDFLAHHDPLTKLVNRALFFDRLSHAVLRATRNKHECTLLYIDVDAFKAVNDELGHEAGDILLCEISKRFQETVRESDTVARLGGDEFAILLEDISRVDSHYVSQKILDHISQPFRVNSSTVNITVSLGMTRFPNETQDINRLLMQADQALYTAKKEGKRTYRKFDAKMKEEFERTRWLEREFEPALLGGSIKPFFQPQYCLLTGHVTGFESLARWQHPIDGFVSPGEFVPVAERLSLMPQLTHAILRQSCASFKRFGPHFPRSRLCINVSASDCKSDRLVRRVEQVISNHALSSDDIELEVTETVLMQNFKTAIEVLNTLHDLGVRVAIDDFGTGFSSLSYLTELPVDTLKIDLMFVQGIGVSAQKETVIKVIIDLAKRLGFQTVGEGVETAEQKEFLRVNGCDYVQGYFFNKALSSEDCLQLGRSGGSKGW